MISLSHNRYRKVKKCITMVILCVILPFFSLPSPVLAQNLALPTPGTLISLSPQFSPLIIQGFKIHPDNPFKFDFIFDKGDSNIPKENFEKECEKLIKYFLASITVPENDLWVNLSPYEQERVIPDSLSGTDMGIDLLAQDYLLKQITASLIHPDEKFGKKFWDKVYKKAYEKFGTTDIPVNTFNKVWILPDVAKVYTHGDNVFITQSKLKVMLDKDFLALEENISSDRLGMDKSSLSEQYESNNLSSKIVKEILLPEIEKEVNEGKNFVQIRQIYHSLILAQWFKKNLKDSILNQAYSNQSKVLGIETEGNLNPENIYAQYIEAFEKGVCDYIKVDYDEYTHRRIPRKYFSGGADLMKVNPEIDPTFSNRGVLTRKASDGNLVSMETAIVDYEKANSPIVKKLTKWRGKFLKTMALAIIFNLAIPLTGAFGSETTPPVNPDYTIEYADQSQEQVVVDESIYSLGDEISQYADLIMDNVSPQDVLNLDGKTNPITGDKYNVNTTHFVKNINNLLKPGKDGKIKMDWQAETLVIALQHKLGIAEDGDLGPITLGYLLNMEKPVETKKMIAGIPPDDENTDFVNLSDTTTVAYDMSGSSTEMDSTIAQDLVAAGTIAKNLIVIDSTTQDLIASNTIVIQGLDASDASVLQETNTIDTIVQEYLQDSILKIQSLVKMPIRISVIQADSVTALPIKTQEMIYKTVFDSIAEVKTISQVSKDTIEDVQDSIILNTPIVADTSKIIDPKIQVAVDSIIDFSKTMYLNRSIPKSDLIDTLSAANELLSFYENLATDLLYRIDEVRTLDELNQIVVPESIPEQLKQEVLKALMIKKFYLRGPNVVVTTSAEASQDTVAERIIAPLEEIKPIYTDSVVSEQSNLAAMEILTTDLLILTDVIDTILYAPDSISLAQVETDLNKIEMTADTVAKKKILKPVFDAIKNFFSKPQADTLLNAEIAIANATIGSLDLLAVVPDSSSLAIDSLGVAALDSATLEDGKKKWFNKFTTNLLTKSRLEGELNYKYRRTKYDGIPYGLTFMNFKARVYPYIFPNNQNFYAGVYGALGPQNIVIQNMYTGDEFILPPFLPDGTYNAKFKPYFMAGYKFPKLFTNGLSGEIGLQSTNLWAGLKYEKEVEIPGIQGVLRISPEGKIWATKGVPADISLPLELKLRNLSVTAEPGILFFNGSQLFYMDIGLESGSFYLNLKKPIQINPRDGEKLSQIGYNDLMTPLEIEAGWKFGNSSLAATYALSSKPSDPGGFDRSEKFDGFGISLKLGFPGESKKTGSTFGLKSRLVRALDDTKLSGKLTMDYLKFLNVAPESTFDAATKNMLRMGFEAEIPIGNFSVGLKGITNISTMNFMDNETKKLTGNLFPVLRYHADTIPLRFLGNKAMPSGGLMVSGETFGGDIDFNLLNRELLNRKKIKIDANGQIWFTGYVENKSVSFIPQLSLSEEFTIRNTKFILDQGIIFAGGAHLMWGITFDRPGWALSVSKPFLGGLPQYENFVNSIDIWKSYNTEVGLRIKGKNFNVKASLGIQSGKKKDVGYKVSPIHSVRIGIEIPFGNEKEKYKTRKKIEYPKKKNAKKSRKSRRQSSALVSAGKASAPALNQIIFKHSLAEMQGEEEYGGINFTESFLEIDQEGISEKLKFSHPTLISYSEAFKIEGFAPIIINIVPITNFKSFFSF